MNRSAAFLSVLGMLLCATAWAQLPNEPPAAESAVRTLVESYVRAFNAGDPKALASYWTEDGQMIDRHGDRVVGRKAIEKRFAAFFADHRDCRLQVRIDAIEAQKDGAAIADLTTELRVHATAKPSEVQSRLRLVAVDGRLGIVRAQDILGLPSSASHLKELEWLVGDWTDDGKRPGRGSAEGSYSWTSNRSFLIHMFTARGGDAAAHGTEMIGWDPRRKAIRSWTFGSQGGFCEGRWKHDGQRWLVSSSGVLPNGSEVSATDVLTRVDDDTLSFRSRDRWRDGKPEPNIGPILLRRQKAAVAAPGAAAAGLP